MFNILSRKKREEEEPQQMEFRDESTDIPYALDDLVNGGSLVIGRYCIDKAPKEIVDWEHGEIYLKDNVVVYRNLSSKGSVIVRTDKELRTNLIRLWAGNESYLKEGDGLHLGSPDNPTYAYGPLFYVIKDDSHKYS